MGFDPELTEEVSSLLDAFNVSDPWGRTKFYHLEINTSLNRVFCKKKNGRSYHKVIEKSIQYGNYEAEVKSTISRALKHVPCSQEQDTSPVRLELQYRIRIMLL
jgi:hypothetical protein